MKKNLFLMILVLVTALILSSCSDRGAQSSAGTGTVNGLAIEDAEAGSAEPDTPEGTSGLAVGESVWVSGMKITLNAVEEGPATSDGSESYLISVTYENYGDSMYSISPFDWSTVEADGTVIGFDMDGRGSFNLVTLPEQKKFTGDVILFRTENSKEIQFKVTARWSNFSAIWLIP